MFLQKTIMMMKMIMRIIEYIYYWTISMPQCYQSLLTRTCDLLAAIKHVSIESHIPSNVTVMYVFVSVIQCGLNAKALFFHLTKRSFIQRLQVYYAPLVSSFQSIQIKCAESQLIGPAHTAKPIPNDSSIVRFVWLASYFCQLRHFRKRLYFQ